MGSKLFNKDNSTLRMCDLKDGQIAEIVDSNYKGILVQRYNNNAVAIGDTNGNSWANIQNNTLRVRVLNAGELIEVF